MSKTNVLIPIVHKSLAIFNFASVICTLLLAEHNITSIPDDSI